MIEPSRCLAAEYSQRADAYARYWAPMIHPMARPLLSGMPLGNARRILDVGTGSGGLWPVVRGVAPGAELWGVDRALGMLRAGGESLRGKVAVMDAQRLGVRPATFDAVLLVFVLFHIPDPVAALREVGRLLHPGGSVGVVVWGQDPGLPGASIWAEELDRAQAGPDSRDPAVMRQSWMDTPDKLAGLLGQGGLKPTNVWGRHFVHDWSIGRLLDIQIHCGLASRRLMSLPADARLACLDRVRVRLASLPAGDLSYRVEVIYGVAQQAV